MNTQQRTLIATLTLCAAVAAPGLSFGALLDRGGGLIYDTDLNITWLADANYARTTGYVNDGLMAWASATSWATNLSYYDSVRGVTYDDWRLPTSDTCVGYNCTGSELGHLIYSELGGVAGQSIGTTHNANYSLFTNLRSSIYWSATVDAFDIYHSAWIFDTYWSGQGTLLKTSTLYAWAVRPGDVAAAASAVPVPAAAWLFSSGLIGLIGVARRKAA
jgi:hypothetical protein